MNKYLQLLSENKMAEAEEFRRNSIPEKLIKFVSLGDNEDENEKKFKALSEGKLWFSSIEALNDPYEYKCMYIDERKLMEHGYDQSFIDGFNKILVEDVKSWALVSLSAASVDNLPMWAYYTNNYRGFCVEYDVLKPDVVFQVNYESNRIPLASIIANFYQEFRKMLESGKDNTPEVEFYATLIRYQFYIKHISWAHEKEYRIIYPLKNANGVLVPIEPIGLKTSRVYAGMNCKEEHVKRLNHIASSLSCGKVTKASISGEHYSLFE